MKTLLCAAVLILTTTSAIADINVTITAYTNTRACTDKTPNITASGFVIGRQFHGQCIALSRDLAKRHRFGDIFQLTTNGGQVYTVKYVDVMPGRHRRTIDLYLSSTKQCYAFGVQKGKLKLIRKGKD